MNHSIIIQPSLWARLFARLAVTYRRAELRSTSIRLDGAASANTTVRLDQFTEVGLRPGWFWGQLQLLVPDGQPIVLGGIPRTRLPLLKQQILARRSACLDALYVLRDHTDDLLRWTEKISRWQRGECWLARHELNLAKVWLDIFAPVLRLPVPDLDDLTTPATIQALTAFRTAMEDPAGFRLQSNRCFVPAELARFQDYFDRIETNPLTDAQRLAVITHEDNTRVIAGAGSGKTSVIVAKAGYLVKKGLCTPEQLLLIAFNRKAAEELQKRIQERVGTDIDALTFHALGLRIIAEAEGKKPTLAKEAEDEQQMQRTLKLIVKELADEDAAFDQALRGYFQSFFAPYKSAFEFEAKLDYHDYLRNHDLRTFQGELVKSFEECEIANFLHLNGIPYEYEHRYPVDTATVLHRQYHPDFYLTEAGLYIEHFGIDRNGNTPPFIDRERYHQGIRWKRELHATYGTPLIETYSYQKREGTLLRDLERILREHGVAFRPISLEAALEGFEKGMRFHPYIKLLAIFLNHFKGGGHTVDGLHQRAKRMDISTDRMTAFLEVFEPVVERFNVELAERGEVDFNDMILKAARHVEARRYRSPFTCILVDEFQDISTGRARLIKALSGQENNYRLFCVGDDWQAIYRFAGSDIALMRDFEAHFGFTETVYLDRTFRFNDRIEAVASRFIQTNPAQIAKTITTHRQASSAQVFVHRPRSKDEPILFDVLQQIADQVDGETGTVKLLGRYNFESDDLPWRDIQTRFRQLQVDFSTVHKAKGLEADFIVALGLRAGRYGFPSEIADDPLLDVVLAQPEPYPNAEERRLFYVALTRARHAVYLLADYSQPSGFLGEIKAYGTELVRAEGFAALEPVICPRCEGGTLVQRTGPHGAFYSCSRYPLCGYKTHACKRCGVGLMRKASDSSILICDNEPCGHQEQPCPRCGAGYLVERNGRYGPFLGCTNFATNNCRYTEKL